MAELARGRPWPAVAALVLAVAAAAYALTLAPGVTWANGGLDSGELIAAAVTGGVPHPSGYPTYLLLARAALLVPGADQALAVTLLSPAAAALAALAAGDLARRWSAAAEPWASAGGLIAGLGLALSPLFWSQAVIAEVYALSALFAALLLRAAAMAALGPGPPSPRRSAATWALAGVALGAHLTVLPFALLWAAADVAGAGPGARPARLARGAAWLALGLLVYLALPLAAASGPPINWGNPVSWRGFWWLVSGSAYAGMAFSVAPDALAARLLAWAPGAPEQLGWAGLALAGLGLARGGRPAPLLRPATVALAALAAAFALGYGSVDAYVYLIPALLVGAVWAGLGAAAALEAVAARSPALAPVAALALAAGVLWQAPLTAAGVDASSDRRAIAYATSVLADAPRGAILVTDDDRATFPLWYYHFARGERADLRLVAAPLLRFPWYRDSLRATYPDLAVPGAAPDGWAEAVTDANAAARPVCRAIAEPAPDVRC